LYPLEALYKPIVSTWSLI